LLDQKALHLTRGQVKLTREDADPADQPRPHLAAGHPIGQLRRRSALAVATILPGH
jgi:hypothetical protein